MRQPNRLARSRRFPRPDQPRCGRCPRRAESSFACLSGKDLDLLDRSKASRTYCRGQIIFHEGSAPTGAYCVLSGRIRMTKMGEEGRAQIVRVIGPGGLFGHQAILGGMPYPGTTVAMEESVLCFLDRGTLLGLLRRNGVLALEVARRACRDLLSAESRLNSMSQLSAERRLAQCLLDLGGDLRSRPGKTPGELTLPRQVLADAAGVAVETAIRVLSRFKSRGLVSGRGRRISLVDLDSLRALAGSD